MRAPLLIFCAFIAGAVYSQNNNNLWETHGNEGDTSQFIGTTNSQPLVFKTSGSEQLRVTEDGRVGVGTDHPEYKLDIGGDAMFREQVFMPSLIQLQTSNSGQEFLVRDIDGQLKIVGLEAMVDVLYEPKWCPTDPIANPTWANGENKIFSRCPQVFVGIATDNPGHSLDVRGRGYFSSYIGIGTQPNANAQVVAATNKEVGFCIDQNYNQDFGYAYKAIVSNPTTKGLGVYNEQFGKDIFTIYADGKLEISNATQKILQLESNGVLRTREVKVDLFSWPDYVFKSDYELMPLEEVEEYIEEEGHLPNVPSAETIENEGLNLGEMNKVLMEKVEELVLHTIQQQKEIEKLKEDLSEQKEELIKLQEAQDSSNK